MKDILWVCLGILIPFVGTCLGSFSTFFIRKTNDELVGALYGFSAGVMLAASVFSLLIPSIETSKSNPRWLPAVFGYALGILLMLVVDKMSDRVESGKSAKSFKMIFAVMIHNIPEGMAVGIALCGAFSGNSDFLGALILAIGIGVQNIPEGAIISMPLASSVGRGKAVMLGVLSAVVEMSGAVAALFCLSLASKILPLMLAFSAGAMQWVTFKELIPETRGNLGFFLIAFGFMLMMTLDVAFS